MLNTFDTINVGEILGKIDLTHRNYCVTHNEWKYNIKLSLSLQCKPKPDNIPGVCIAETHNVRSVYYLNFYIYSPSRKLGTTLLYFYISSQDRPSMLKIYRCDSPLSSFSFHPSAPTYSLISYDHHKFINLILFLRLALRWNRLKVGQRIRHETESQ